MKETTDTSVMESTAEDLISHKLLRGGILVAKPKVDQEGADLLGLLQVTDGARFCRIQCKGRSLLGSAHTSVELPARYVTSAFVLFLFVETGDQDTTHLFVFLGSEIQQAWTPIEIDGKPGYRLSISKAKVERDLTPYRFTDQRVEEVKRVIRNANVAGEFSALGATGAMSYSSELNRFRSWGMFR